MNDIIIREMTAVDIGAVCDIEKSSFKTPWSEGAVCDEINKSYSRYFTALCGDEIVGFAGVWCIQETAELVRIAVAPEFLRRGIGGMLISEVFAHAKNSGCERIMLEVRKNNAPAVNLYKKHKFREITVRKGYYDGEDALIMEAATE